MKTVRTLVYRNSKLFLKDKGLFFTSLITPLILLVLYATFLWDVFEDSFLMGFANIEIEQSIINGCVGGQLMSSLLAVSCVTVAFCANMLMVQDKANGTIADIDVSPVKGSTVAISYYIATFFVTFIINIIAMAACLIYISTIGWYFTVSDILMLILDIFVMVMFGTALSSLINFFLNSQGQISAVGTIVSSGYGFICGAYMPISQFSEGLQKVISFLPGTYGTVLFRNHSMRSALNELKTVGVSEEELENIKYTLDCNIDLLGNKVNEPTMFAIVVGTVLVVLTAYILLNKFKQPKK